MLLFLPSHSSTRACVTVLVLCGRRTLTLSSSIPRTSARHRSCWSSPGLYKVKEALFAKDSGVVRGGIQRLPHLKSCDVEQENNPIRILVLTLYELNEAMLEEQRKMVQEKLHLKSIPR